jgi:hypothetical protein
MCNSVVCLTCHFEVSTVFPGVWWGRCVWYAVRQGVGLKFDSGPAEEGLEEVFDFVQRAGNVDCCILDAQPLLESRLLWRDGTW